MRRGNGYHPPANVVNCRIRGKAGENMEPVETIYVEETTVGCDGGAGPLGHPQVYLNLGAKGETDCPYCGRRYILKEGGGRAGERS